MAFCDTRWFLLIAVIRVSKGSLFLDMVALGKPSKGQNGMGDRQVLGGRGRNTRRSLTRG